MLVALDSNVLVALWKPTDALHSAATHALTGWEGRGASFILSAVAWAEVLTGVLRSSPQREGTLVSFRDRAIDRVVPVDEDVGTVAARLRNRDHGLRTPDALIAATAKTVGAGVLLTGDRKLKRIDPELVELICP